jgi:hypothetical protein
MALLANPRRNHVIHLALLGTFLFFDFLTLVISTAFVHEGKHSWIGESFLPWMACLLLVSDAMV